MFAEDVGKSSKDPPWPTLVVVALEVVLEAVFEELVEVLLWWLVVGVAEVLAEVVAEEVEVVVEEGAGEVETLWALKRVDPIEIKRIVKETLK